MWYSLYLNLSQKSSRANLDENFYKTFQSKYFGPRTLWSEKILDGPQNLAKIGSYCLDIAVIRANVARTNMGLTYMASVKDGSRNLPLKLS